MSKYRFKESSIYIDGTDIPKNILNIKDSKFIHALEKKLLDNSYIFFNIKALVGCSPRLHRSNVNPFGFDGVFMGKHPTDIYLNFKSLSANLFFMSILLNGTLGNVPL